MLSIDQVIMQDFLHIMLILAPLGALALCQLAGSYVTLPCGCACTVIDVMFSKKRSQIHLIDNT